MASRLSKQEFSAAFFALENRLVAKTQQQLRCTLDEAVDLVAEVRLVALVILERFDPNRYDYQGQTRDWAYRVDWSSRFALWVGEIHRRQCLNYRTWQSRQVPTIPLDAARDLEAPSEPNWRESHQGFIDALPHTQRLVVNAHLDGYTNLEIADTLGCHRNTVCNILKAAEAQLREWSGSAFEFDLHPELTLKEFTDLSKVVVYRKPPGKIGLWKRQLPRDRAFLLTPVGRRAA